MALPLGFHVTLKNLQALDLQEDRWGTVTVFLKLDTSGEQASELAARLEKRHSALVELVSPEAGMQHFREASGFGQALDLFDRITVRKFRVKSRAKS